MADRADALGQFGVTASARSRAADCQFGIVGRSGRVLREGVQDVGEQQLLMLLLVIEPELDSGAQDFGKRCRARFDDQPLDRRIDMRAIGGDLAGVRPRDQPALRPRMARAGGDVIGVEQEREALVETWIARRDSAAAGTVSKNQVVCARCHLVGLASGIDWTIWSSGDSGAARRSVSPRTMRKASRSLVRSYCERAAGLGAATL